MSRRRLINSDTSLSIEDLYLEGVRVNLDDFKQTILLDDRPIVIPGNNQFVLLPSEMGLQPPSYFASVPYTGLSIYEEYVSSDFLVTGWSAYLGVSGSGPAHFASGTSGAAILSPLSGSVYLRSTTNPNSRITIASFSINSGLYASSGSFAEKTISGGCILGWDIYSGLSGAEDFSLVLNGRYQDLYEGNISQGVVMSSGDASISFFSEYGGTGNTLLEYYTANEFIATRWGVYVSSTGTGPSNLSYNSPLSGRLYYREPKSTGTVTIAEFTLDSGQYYSNYTLPAEKYIPFRHMVGVDIYRSLSNIRNLNIVLGGKSISSANYYKSLITQAQFESFSGFITGLVESGTAGVSSLNTLYGPVSIAGSGGISVVNVGSIIYIGYTGASGSASAGITGDYVKTLNGLTGIISINASGGLKSISVGNAFYFDIESGVLDSIYAKKSETGNFATYTQLTDASGYLAGLIGGGGTAVSVTGGPNMPSAIFSGLGGTSVAQSGSYILISGGSSAALPDDYTTIRNLAILSYL